MNGDHTWQDVVRYARAHHLLQLAAGLCAASVAAYFAADRQLVIPAATANGSIAIPSMVYTALPFAVLVVVSLHSSMASLEQAATSALRRAELIHLSLLTALSCTLFAAACYAGGGEQMTAGPLAEAVRNVLLFLGLGLISARLFGRALAWILPLADFVVICYWGAHDGGNPHWWAWQLLSYTEPTAWAATLLMLPAGVTVLWFLPWRPPGSGYPTDAGFVRRLLRKRRRSTRTGL